MNCTNCGKKITRGKWCSDKCRKEYARKSDKNPDKIKVGQIKSDTCPKCKLGNYNKSDKWSHSACWRTQTEIEEHYTEKNFPSKNIRYHMFGRSPSISPYSKSDPRSKAYYDS